MSVDSTQQDNDDNYVARTGVSLVIAVMVISSLPLFAAMVVWLPGWLEQPGLATAGMAGF